MISPASGARRCARARPRCPSRSRRSAARAAASSSPTSSGTSWVGRPEQRVGEEAEPGEGADDDEGDEPRPASADAGGGRCPIDSSGAGPRPARRRRGGAVGGGVGRRRRRAGARGRRARRRRSGGAVATGRRHELVLGAVDVAVVRRGGSVAGGVRRRSAPAAAAARSRPSAGVVGAASGVDAPPAAATPRPRRPARRGGRRRAVGRRLGATGGRRAAIAWSSVGGRATPPVGSFGRRIWLGSSSNRLVIDERDRRRAGQLLGRPHERPAELGGRRAVGRLGPTGPLEHRRQRAEVGRDRHQPADRAPTAWRPSSGRRTAPCP